MKIIENLLLRKQSKLKKKIHKASCETAQRTADLRILLKEQEGKLPMLLFRQDYPKVKNRVFDVLERIQLKKDEDVGEELDQLTPALDELVFIINEEKVRLTSS